MKNILNYTLIFTLCLIFQNSTFADTEDSKLKITTSFSILSDITKNITEDLAEINTIIPLGSEPHGFNLKPKDLLTIEKSDIVFINGLGFEGFLERMRKNDKFVVVSQGITSITSDEHQGTDPHAWQNPLNTIIYVKNITDALCKVNEINCQKYQENSSKYIKKLEDIDAQYSEIFKNIPEGNRLMITTHDAFNYLAQRYNIKIKAPFGAFSGQEPSARSFAELEKLISNNQIKAIFIENLSNNTAVYELAKNHNVEINGKLFTDSLSNDDEGNTYLKMLDHNLKTISSAMKPKTEKKK